MKTGGLFPSVQAEMHSDSKPHKKKKKKKAKRRRSSSSTSSDSGGDQWVEKSSAVTAAAPAAPQPAAAAVEPAAAQRDAWMTVESVFAGVTAGEVRDKRRQTKQQAREAEERQRQADYEARKWREPSGSAAPSAPVGDGGASWLRRALERAKQQAADTGRSLEDVVADRWGSMEKLQSMLDAAERRAAPARPATGERVTRERGWRRGNERQRSGSREGRRGDSRERRRSRSREKRRDRSRERRRSMSRERRRSMSRERKDRRSRERRRSMSREKRRSRSTDRRRSRSTSTERKRERSKERKRSPSHERGHNSRRSRSADRKGDRVREGKLSSGKGCSDGGDCRREHRADAGAQDGKTRGDWRKPATEPPAAPPPPSADSGAAGGISPRGNSARNSASPVDDSADEEEAQPAAGSTPARPLTDSEMNALAAKIIKAELNGDDDDVAALQKQLDTARQLRAAGGSAGRPGDKAEQVVVVVGKGERGSASGGGERPNKRRKADTHRGGERTKYFADDDRLNLRDMFERERRTTASDEAAALARLAGRGVRQSRHHDDEHGLDEQLAERAGRAEPERAQDERAAASARAQHRHMERCSRCFDSRLTLRHMIAALGEKCYLALPAGRSLTEHHCLIVPMQHAVSLTALDEDGWAEMARFRAALVAMFSATEQDVIFFESALKLRTHPHAALHCVPVPRESGELAPIYFKKALEESETEWSQNKKVVDLRGRDVRRAVPKGLPYFFVDFGLQPGFAHVVEDEDLFPDNFAQEVIGGMLELDPSAWRRSKSETLEQQRRKVMNFTKVWEPHDFTKDG